MTRTGDHMADMKQEHETKPKQDVTLSLFALSVNSISLRKYYSFNSVRSIHRAMQF